MTKHLNLFGLARAARLPFRIECFVLDMIPAKPNAEPQPSAAQNVNLGRLFANQSGLSLRRD